MIHVFLGTKAQLVKMGPIMKLMQDEGIDYNFIRSGQHWDTFSDILNNFGITKDPDHILYQGEDITGIAQMGKWAAEILLKYRSKKVLSELFQGDNKGIVLNHGDTFSTLLGAYLGKKHGLHCGHVESGLRSFNYFHPFPEELTRVITFRLCDYHFAPGEWALNNLEKHKGEKVNTHYNTLLDSLELSAQSGNAISEKPFGLVSIHRFENIFKKKRLRSIIDALIDSPLDQRLLFILHKPTENKLREYGLLEKLVNDDRIELHPRYDYFSFMSLLRSSEYLVTDGGSNQEECFYLGKPCLLMREKTERQEGLQKNVVLSRYKTDLINHFLSNYTHYTTEAVIPDRSPSRIILDSIRAFS